MKSPARILIVDDDRRIREMLAAYLEDEGFEISQAEDGRQLRAEIAAAEIDLVLLDQVIPGEDGLTLLRELRRRSSVPVIMITGKGEMLDRVIGLEVGADDYIAKPFHLREVLARIRAVLRRSPQASSSQASPPRASNPDAETARAGREAGRLAFAGWTLDPRRRELRDSGGVEVELTTGEFNLLLAFLEAPNRPLNRDQLMDKLGGRDWSPYDRSIDTQVGRLRKKIEADPKNPALIKTVRGIGYVFTPEVATT
ncbi:MAG: response regulator [Kiloniellales bacterium]|nr:response regulator [Kiloniellales bacterium]